MDETIHQLIVLYVFIALGWIFGKWKKIPLTKSNLLSVLFLNLFLPCKIFLNFSSRFTRYYLRENYITILIATGVLLLMVGVAKVCASRLTEDDFGRRIYRYALAISSYASMGYVLAESLSGEAGLTNMIFFCIPFAVYTYTFGYAMLSGKGSFFKKLLNPMTAAIFLGMFFGLLQIPIPRVVNTVLQSASGCVGPIGMLFVGMVLSVFPFREILPDAGSAIYTVLRLVVFPLAVFGICQGLSLLFPLPEAVYPAAVIMACMPCGLNAVIFPSLNGGDSKLGAKLVLFTHVMCCVTIPIWIWVLSSV